MMVGSGWYVVGFGHHGELLSVRLLTTAALCEALAAVVAVPARTHAEAAAKARPVAHAFLRLDVDLPRYSEKGRP